MTNFLESSGALGVFLDSSTPGRQASAPKSQILYFEDDDLNFPGSVWNLDYSQQPTGFISLPPDRLIWQFFTSQLQIFPNPSTKMDLQRSLLARLSPLILEQETGELNHQFERLFGPSDKTASWSSSTWLFILYRTTYSCYMREHLSWNGFFAKENQPWEG